MQIVPLQATPNQTVNVQLGDQAVTLNVYFKGAAIFVDVLVNDALVIAGVIAMNGVLMVRSLYLGFIGDLAFFDNQPDPIAGPSDPEYAGLGTRWPLYYFTPADLAPYDLPAGVA